MNRDIGIDKAEASRETWHFLRGVEGLEVTAWWWWLGCVFWQVLCWGAVVIHVVLLTSYLNLFDSSPKSAPPKWIYYVYCFLVIVALLVLWRATALFINARFGGWRAIRRQLDNSDLASRIFSQELNAIRIFDYMLSPVRWLEQQKDTGKVARKLSLKDEMVLVARHLDWFLAPPRRLNTPVFSIASWSLFWLAILLMIVDLLIHPPFDTSNPSFFGMLGFGALICLSLALELLPAVRRWANAKTLAAYLRDHLVD